MATIAKLIDDEALFEIEADLDPGIFPIRFLYAVPGFSRFLDDLSEYESLWNIEQSPIEQFDDLLNEFLGTVPLTVSWRFGPIQPAKGKQWPGIWELKAPDLRIFGWFAEKDKFIAFDGCNAQLIKDHPGMYGGFRDEAVRCRGQLPLDEPKFIAGRDHSDVISLIYRP